MPELEVLEIMMATMMTIATIIYSLVCIKRRDLVIYLPGLISLLVSFLCTNLEAIAFPDEYNLGEHTFLMIAGILWATAAIINLIGFKFEDGRLVISRGT